jgi:hypothetical protein
VRAVTKQEFAAKTGAVSSELLYSRAEHIYMESDLFTHQGQLVDFYRIFGNYGINALYFEVFYANNWREHCARAKRRAD